MSEGSADPPTTGRVDEAPGRSFSWTEGLKANRGAIGVMLVAVILQVLGAVLLKVLADERHSLAFVFLLLGVGAVLVLNLVRLLVWGYAHRRFPLSTTFPLSSLFFPAMLGVATWFGDEIGSVQILGALLIASGTFWLSAKAPPA